MTVKYLQELLDFTEAIVLKMAERKAKPQDIPGLWNRADHLFHLSCWMDYSRRQINADMRGASAPDLGDIAQANQAFYEQHIGENLSNAVERFKKEVIKHREYQAGFTPEDLLREDLPHQFLKPLSWHLAVDAFTHPMQHILYYYFIHRDVPALVEFIHAMDETLMTYGKGKPGVYHLGEFFDYKQEILDEKILNLGLSEDQIQNDPALQHFLQANTKD